MFIKDIFFRGSQGKRLRYFQREHHEGEKRVCRLRLIGLFVFYLNHLANQYIIHPMSTGFHYRVSAVVFFWFLFAIALWYVTSIKNRYQPWFAYLSTTVDIVSLSIIVLIGGKSLSQIFVLYYPLIVLGGIRYSFGATIYAGGLSAVCYTFAAIINDLLAGGQVDSMELVIRVLAMIFLALIAAYVVENGSNLVNRIVDEEIKVKQIKDTLARYVSTQVADEILKSGTDFLMKGEQRNVTVLLSDIRGFTSIAEKITAEEVVELLNGYFSKMIDIVFKYRGTLDKFMGDAIMVVFGAPLPDEEHALNAVKTAIEMQADVEQFNEERRKSGKPEIYIGIGINSGEVVAGNIGSEKRLEYTVIGDTVNLTQRIESQSQKGEILISEETFNYVNGQYSVNPLPKIKVKGRQTPVQIYRLSRFAPGRE